MYTFELLYVTYPFLALELILGAGPIISAHFRFLQCGVHFLPSLCAAMNPTRILHGVCLLLLQVLQQQRVSARIDINCTALKIQDTECAYQVIKVLNTFINVDGNYSSYISPVASMYDLPMEVNVTMRLNHIPDVDVLQGTVQVSRSLNIKSHHTIMPAIPHVSP